MRKDPSIIFVIRTGESAKFLGSSPYIRDLATIVIGYGMAINIVEVTWKSKLKAAFPDPNRYLKHVDTCNDVLDSASHLYISYLSLILI